MAGGWGTPLAVAIVACACTVDADDGTTIGVVTAGPVSAGSGSATAAATSTGDGDGTEGSGTEAPSDDATAGDDATSTGTSDSGGSSTGPMTDPQPADGMYSHCVLINDCVGLTTCVLATDEDGFCSNNGCMDPVADCDPSPGGTATVTCIEYAVQIVPEDVCALDCSGGATCPAGMECQDVQGNLVCV